ncbi:MAG: tetratricopeptide repeat protein [Candidatus Brocadiaceae bacterium]|jgi:tetratricopeptide (TPR) repeat protein
MSNDQPQQKHPEHEDLLELLGRVKVFLWKNAVHIALIVAIIAVAAAAYRYYELTRQTRRHQAWDTLGSLPDSSLLIMRSGEGGEMLRREALKACRRVAEGPETSATPWALLRLGGLLATTGQWSEAADAYERLLSEYAGSAAAQTARPAHAAVLEQVGRHGEAAATYEGLAAEGSPYYLFHAARCRELNGERAVAEEHYRKFLESDQPEDLREMAHARLADVVEGELLDPPPEPMPPAPVETPVQELSLPADTEVAPGLPLPAVPPER